MGRERYEDSKRGSRLPSHAEGNTARTTPVDHQQMTPLIATMTIRAITSSPIYLAAYVQQQLQSRIEGGEDSSYTTLRKAAAGDTARTAPTVVVTWQLQRNCHRSSEGEKRQRSGGLGRHLTILAELQSKPKLAEELPHCRDHQL